LIPETDVSWLLLFSILVVEFVPSDTVNVTGFIISDFLSSSSKYEKVPSIVLFVWYSIPAEETITLKYRLTAENGSIGNKTIDGTFSYLEEEERKSEIIDPVTFTVSEGTNSTNSTTSIENNNSQDTPVSGIRTIQNVGKEYIVTVSIMKGNQDGFSRLKENIPSGFTASKIEAAGGVYKFTNNIVKFLWTNIPADKSLITVSYKLSPTENAPQAFAISGYFSAEFLMVDDTPQSIEIPAVTIGEIAEETVEEVTEGIAEEVVAEEIVAEEIVAEEIAAEEVAEEIAEEIVAEEVVAEEVVAEEVAAEEVVAEEVVAEEVVAEEVVAEEVVAEEAIVAEVAEETASTTIVTNESPTTGVSFRVQVLAAHKTVDAKYIQKRYNGYNNKLNLDNHEGWVKYTTKSLKTYKDARDTRNDFKRYEFPGPFVTAYNSGERITVQEGLMLSSQKWVK
ncbi:MAG: hypothetical protein P8L20_06500, partial [Flavobacteriales bacterium]|nr:hypothetical protein [Flavobacteriales bacterium]